MRARVRLRRARQLNSLAEDPHRKPADSDRDALAVQIELDEARRPNISARVHFHSVNNGEEIVTPQTIEVYGLV